MLALALALPPAVILASAWAPERALGQSKGDVDDARKRMEKAQALFQQEKYAEAVTEFEAAYDKHHYEAFLFNAAFSAEKAGDRQRAIARYKEFLDKNPTASDSADIKQTIARLEAELAGPPDGGATGDGGEADGGAPPPPPPVATPSKTTMRSLVVIESEPPGAPLSIWERTDPTAPKFDPAGPNKGWRQVTSGARTPHDLPLGVGHYHVIIEKFQDYRRSETDMNLAPGYVYRFKANLSQGAFLGLLRIKPSVEGAKVYVDDPPPHKHAPTGRGTVDALVESGDHQVWVVAPGHETFSKKVHVEHGDAVDVAAELARVGWGILRIDGNTDEIEVEIDGKSQGVYRAQSGPLRLELPAGRHQVEIDSSGKKAYEGEVDIPRGQEVAVHATLIDSYGRGKAIAAGIGAVGAGVAGYLLLKQSDKGGDDADLFKAVSTGCFIGAGVLGVASVFLFIYDPNPDSLLKVDRARDLEENAPPAQKVGVRVVPMIDMGAPARPPTATVPTSRALGPTGSGLLVEGRF